MSKTINGVVEAKNFSGAFVSRVTFVNGAIVAIEPIKGYSKADRFDLACINHYLKEWPEAELSRVVSTGVYNPTAQDDTLWEDMALHGCQ